MAGVEFKERILQSVFVWVEDRHRQR